MQGRATTASSAPKLDPSQHRGCCMHPCPSSDLVVANTGTRNPVVAYPKPPSPFLDPRETHEGRGIPIASLFWPFAVCIFVMLLPCSRACENRSRTTSKNDLGLRLQLPTVGLGERWHAMYNPHRLVGFYRCSLKDGDSLVVTLQPLCLKRFWFPAPLNDIWWNMQYRQSFHTTRNCFFLSVH